MFVYNNLYEFGFYGRLLLNGVFFVYVDIVVVDGIWLLNKLKIELGWKELIVEYGGKFYFDLVGIF